MKKILSVLLVLSCLLVCCACRGDTTEKDPLENKVVYGEKYISNRDTQLPENEQRYLIVEADRLKYHHYSAGTETVEHYTIVCKYEVVDEATIAYFFDSFEFHSDHTIPSSYMDYDSDFSEILLLSENVIFDRGGGIFVRESYLNTELVNFGK